MNNHLYPSVDEQTRFLSDPTSYYGTYPATIEPIYRPPLIGKDSYRPQIVLRPSNSFPSDTSSKAVTCLSASLSIISPLMAEFVSVFVTLFVFNHLDTELAVMHTASLNRSSILALTHAVCFAVFASAFKTVHLSPAVTLTHLLTGSTSQLFCLLIVPTQFLAGFLAVIANVNLRSASSLPPPPSLKHDLSIPWTNAAYQLIISQMIGSFLICSSHVSSFGVRREDDNHNGFILSRFRISALLNPAVPLFLATAIASFLSLIQSSVPCCPLQAFSLCAYRFVDNFADHSFTSHHIYWIGPIVGSLLACAICKFLLSPKYFMDRNSDI
ncbi:unnamed protein product, partial [Mesorhabditis belari]|uniref:Aquaporin n=1 Tax=Mesorhabditis belari TaxID=2138241 RepID=A0AAF3J9E4_9BILA